jgi:hypothetical protein
LKGIAGATDVIQSELSSLTDFGSKTNLSSFSAINEFLQVIRISSIYLTEIIEQMMNFSKVRKKKERERKNKKNLKY